MFQNINELRTYDNRSIVVRADPDTELRDLFRARVFQSYAKLDEALMRPDIHLGSPPSQLAKAGRMNAQGISVFYGAKDPSVALAEVRPPVGSKVAVARFEIILPLNLLDLTSLARIHPEGSVS